MDLNEIEAKADGMLARLLSKKETGGYRAGVAETRDICFRLEALAQTAQIKATVAFRKEREAERNGQQAAYQLGVPQAPVAASPWSACGAVHPRELVLSEGVDL